MFSQNTPYFNAQYLALHDFGDVLTSDRLDHYRVNINIQGELIQLQKFMFDTIG